MKSGSSNIYFIFDNNNEIIAVKKVIFRKPLEKLNKELHCLQLLSEHEYFPNILKTNNQNTIVLSYCGSRLDKLQNDLPDNWKEQVQEIIKLLEQNNIVHSDINPGNVCIKDDIIHLIDFGNIRFRNDEFFLRRDYLGYREWQHKKLSIICNAVYENKDPWKELHEY